MVTHQIVSTILHTNKIKAVPTQKYLLLYCIINQYDLSRRGGAQWAELP